MSIPRIIPTASLTLDVVPFPEAKWRTLADFSTTFDPCEIDDYGAKTADLDNALSTSSLVELRSHLYVEQRRWNHFDGIQGTVYLIDVNPFSVILTPWPVLHEL